MQEIAYVNFSIKTPLKDTTGNQTPNLASNNSDNNNALFFVTVFLLLIILGSSYFLLIRSKKNKISGEYVPLRVITPGPSVPGDSKSSPENNNVPVPKSKTDTVDRREGGSRQDNKIQGHVPQSRRLRPRPSVPGDSKSCS